MKRFCMLMVAAVLLAARAGAVTQWDAPAAVLAISVGPSGDVYLLSEQGGIIWQYGPQGQLHGSFTVPGAGGLAVGPGDTVSVLVGSFTGDSIARFAPGWVPASGWSFYLPPDFAGLAAGPDGSVYVAGYDVFRFAPDGSQRRFDGSCRECSGIAVDLDGTVYTLQGSNVAGITKVRPDGSVEWVWSFPRDPDDSNSAIRPASRIASAPDGGLFLRFGSSPNFERWDGERNRQAIWNGPGHLLAGDGNGVLYAVAGQTVYRYEPADATRAHAATWGAVKARWKP